VREPLPLPRHDADRERSSLPANRLAISLVEGWRGEICHTAITDERGRFRRFKVVDPSFHNWTGLAMALRDQQISDFPLCNKSFNLSYCGFDL
jgi:Ni,Fe-hydrogenase III large subunit